MAAPKYSISKVVAAAEAGRVELAWERAKKIVHDYVPSFLAAIRFSEALVASLEEKHFVRTVVLDLPPYSDAFDEYLRHLPAAVAKEFGLQSVRDWYVKLRLVEDDHGDPVVCISMHPAERKRH